MEKISKEAFIKELTDEFKGWLATGNRSRSSWWSSIEEKAHEKFYLHYEQDKS